MKPLLLALLLAALCGCGVLTEEQMKPDSDFRYIAACLVGLIFAVMMVRMCVHK